MKEPHDEGLARPIVAESCAARSQGRRRSVDRGTREPGIGPVRAESAGPQTWDVEGPTPRGVKRLIEQVAPACGLDAKAIDAQLSRRRLRRRSLKTGANTISNDGPEHQRPTTAGREPRT